MLPTPVLLNAFCGSVVLIPGTWRSRVERDVVQPVVVFKICVFSSVPHCGFWTHPSLNKVMKHICLCVFSPQFALYPFCVCREIAPIQRGPTVSHPLLRSLANTFLSWNRSYLSLISLLPFLPYEIYLKFETINKNL